MARMFKFTPVRYLMQPHRLIYLLMSAPCNTLSSISIAVGGKNITISLGVYNFRRPNTTAHACIAGLVGSSELVNGKLTCWFLCRQH
jgi:hypothetical protein